MRARCSVCGGIIPVHHDAVVGAPVAAAAGAFERGGVLEAAVGAGTLEGAPPLEPEFNPPSEGHAAGASAATDVPESPLYTTVAPREATVAAPAAPQRPPVQPNVDPAPAPPATAPRIGPRRVNPFLNNDPAQRARRLARALVSDLVAYHPEKREEGLRAGTLKELFREDIRKSWQEYVEQVGAPVAESTPHFQDALNDILAGGRRVF